MKRLIITFVIFCILIVNAIAAPTIIQGYNAKGLGLNITYPGSWQGSINADSNLVEMHGTGNTSYTISGAYRLVNAIILKSDGSSNTTLIVNILKNGEIVDSDEVRSPTGEALVQAIL